MITSVDGTFSSLMGGRDIVINGAGFDSDTGNAADSFDVSVGGIPCDVSSVTNNQIACTTGAYDNTVKLRAATRGFSYKETGAPADDIEIEIGSVVEWT